jgi:CheY-like chemotaxis protein
MPFHTRSIDLEEIVQEALKSFSTHLERHQLQVEIESPLFVRADRDRVIQVLVNLLSNALKYSPDGGLIRIATQESHDQVRISVTDQGLGLPPEALSRLFEKFYRIDSRRHRSVGGTGLGLAICKQIVEGMGGQIWASSEGLGRGSTFGLTLPIAAPVTEPVTADRPRVAMGRILLVKDDPSLVALILEQLGEAGYVVEVVVSGEEAIERARAERPSAVVLDVGLAGRLDGWDVLASLRSDPALTDVPVVMISGRDERAYGLALGVDEFLVKPVPKDRLIETLRRVAGDAPANKPILVADDDPFVRRIHEEALKSAGFEVKTASDGAEALQAMYEEPPLAVVLDLCMPGVDGFQVLDEMKRQPALVSVPVIVVTAKELDAVEREVLSSGVTALLQKSGGSGSDIVGLLRRAVAGPPVP